MLQPLIASTSASLSTNGSLRWEASRLPTVDLPDPIIPIKAIERRGTEAREVIAAGAIQARGCWGKRPGMRRTSFAPPRRRRSPWPTVLLILLALLIGLLVYLSTVDTEQPQTRIEQDVTNAVLAN